jgi:hypothetical protein
VVVETKKKLVAEPGECRRWHGAAGAPPSHRAVD